MNEQLPKIYIDVDGTIANYIDALFKAFNINKTHDDVTQYDFYEMLGLDTKAVRAELEIKEFWLSLQPYPWAKPLLKAAKRIDPNYKICTRTTRHINSYVGKLEWLNKNLGVRPDRVLLMPPNQYKHILSRPGRLLIDNYYKECELWEKQGGRALLINPHTPMEGLLPEQIFDELDNL